MILKVKLQYRMIRIQIGTKITNLYRISTILTSLLIVRRISHTEGLIQTCYPAA